MNPENRLERDASFVPDILVVFGRGVNHYIKDGVDKFRLTTMFMEFDDSVKDELPEIDILNPPDETFPNAVAGGGNSNLLGGVHFLLNLKSRGHYVKELIFAAGRPPYLQKLSDHLSEGDVMIEKYQRLQKFFGLPEIPVLNFRDNRNTWDDVRETLRYAESRGYKKVTIIGIGPHPPRIKEFLRKAKEENGWGKIDVEVLSSWDILSKVDGRFKKIVEFVESTSACQKTVDGENRGIEMIRNGTYRLQK